MQSLMSSVSLVAESSGIEPQVLMEKAFENVRNGGMKRELLQNIVESNVLNGGVHDQLNAEDAEQHPKLHMI